MARSPYTFRLWYPYQHRRRRKEGAERITAPHPLGSYSDKSETNSPNPEWCPKRPCYITDIFGVGRKSRWRLSLKSHNIFGKNWRKFWWKLFFADHTIYLENLKKKKNFEHSGKSFLTLPSPNCYALLRSCLPIFIQLE